MDLMWTRHWNFQCKTEINFAGDIMEKALKGKVIVISGGTKGVGRAMAEECALRGADVVIGGRDETAAKMIMRQIATYGQNAIFVHTELENVDDCRESPTLQLLESQERHLAAPLKVYDPFITEDIVENQYHDLDAFLADVDMVVIMVNHNEIKQKMDKLRGKIVFDTRKVCELPGVYRL